MQTKILEAAQRLIETEGVENVSIRKIAQAIEYSPATIYHYFDSKEQIIDQIITDDYEKMIAVLSAGPFFEQMSEESVRSNIANYINFAVAMGDRYKNVMLSDSPTVLAHTSVLQKGAEAERPAIAMLCHALRGFPGLTECKDSDIEVIAQVIWSMLFGLALRLMTEHTDEEQKQRLINQAADFILNMIENKGR
ncbi:TetR/AcrR family transcriptional regulator [Sporolactobacillus pectinivorans]|uniref:TetR/AcrR family transcriptional regulator n=1 Tax=Sporolactobacillus pectinivorans TaxID=1591408 RepID=UPI000C2678E9|nr:TetR/AcrR family transcriptional regulator [Sporolactobacillus pectinivorans]